MNAGTGFSSFEEDFRNLNVEGRELGHRPSSAILSAHVPIRPFHLLISSQHPSPQATTFTSPAHIFKRLVVLASIRDATAMPTPLNKSLAAPLGCEGVERVSYNVGHKWDEPEGRAAKMAGRRRTNLCFVFRR